MRTCLFPSLNNEERMLDLNGKRTYFESALFENNKRNRFLTFTGLAKDISVRILHRLNPRSTF